MSRRYVIFLRTVLIALVVATAPLFAADMILDQYAASQARLEMEAMGTRYIQRAESAISGTVTALQRLDRDNIQTCNPEDRLLFRKVVIREGMIDAVGLVDASGKRMCIVPDVELTGEAILPLLRQDGPLVGIGMLDRSFLGARAAVISWDLRNSYRLFAEVTPAAVAVEPGPEYLLAYRRAEVRLGNDLLWYSTGGFNSESSGPGKSIVVNVKSDRYPLSATIVAPTSAAVLLVQPLKLVAAAGCAGFALLLVAAGVWISWRPESEANDEFIAAIRNGEFIPYYQPVMDVESGALRGCEVLMRWRRDNGTIISPGQFMAYAENNGHIFDMTRHVMLQTVEEVSAMYGEHPDLKLSINLFAGHFLDRQIVLDIKQTYEKSEIAFQQIVVEVTERHPLDDMERARKIIAELQALGVRVALDDVGTGHGGMAYLQKLGVDIIKIDKMFIDTLGTDDNSTTIVDSMVELADNLGMGIIAEGVESEEQIERLLELGVTAAQGYYFAKPMPAKEFIEFAENLELKEIEASRTSGNAAENANGLGGEAAA